MRLITPQGTTYEVFGEPFREGEIVGGFVVDHVEHDSCFLRLPETDAEEEAYGRWVERLRP